MKTKMLLTVAFVLGCALPFAITYVMNTSSPQTVELLTLRGKQVIATGCIAVLVWLFCDVLRSIWSGK